MTERLEVEDLLEINLELCSDTRENSACLDLDGLSAAIERPWSGYGDHELFPTLYAKAAALLHGIASRQVFENGNKRTAWAAGVAFLDINGIDIGSIETVYSDMFVRAAALDHSLEVGDLAEWFEVAHRSFLARGSALFEAFDGQRVETPVGVLPYGLPVDVRAVSSVLFRNEGGRLKTYLIETELAPENAAPSQEERHGHVFAAFDMSHNEFRTTFGGMVSALSQSEPPNPGRNKPCPCGSGRKYEFCHGAPSVRG